MLENNISIFRTWKLNKTGIPSLAGAIRHKNEGSFFLLVLGSFGMMPSWGRRLGYFSGRNVWGGEGDWSLHGNTKNFRVQVPHTSDVFFPSTKLAPYRQFLALQKRLFHGQTPPFMGFAVKFPHLGTGSGITSTTLRVTVRRTLSTRSGTQSGTYTGAIVAVILTGAQWWWRWGPPPRVLDEAVEQRWFVFDTRPVLWPSLGPFQCQQLSQACLLLK